MSADYKYLKASLSVSSGASASPKNSYIELFQETLNQEFYNSSNWWTIQEETSIGSGVFQNVDVRITTLINGETGLKLGDDWKEILFKEIAHEVELGRYYVFDNNTWLTINTEIIKNLAGTCAVRRCNNTLRWIDETTGAHYQEPCCIEYLVKEPRNYMTGGSPFITPGGFLHIQTQFNERTNLINENQRFLFGNAEHWTGYKVIGTGLNDFQNTVTENNTSAKILVIDLVADFVNDELDDIVNGIANINRHSYEIVLDKEEAEGVSGNTIQLTATVIHNGEVVARDLIWETSDSEIAIVDENGTVTLIANGECTITANIENNTAVYGECNVTVTDSPAPNLVVKLYPETNYILEGSEKTYSVYLYENDIAQPDTFTITCNENDVSTDNFTFSQTDDNHFKIGNILRDVSSYLTISCIDDEDGSITQTFDIYLRGGW
jgi:hypothetical protein